VSEVSDRTVPLALTAAWAFLLRGLATYASYRVKLSMGLASLVLSLVTFSFVGKVVAQAGPGFVARYGTSYSSFAIVGLVVHSVASSGLHSFRTAVRREQLQGTLELLATMRLPFPALVALSGLGEMALTAVGGGALMAGAAALVGFELPFGPGLVVGAALYALTMAGAGLASAGVVMVSKEGEPVSWLVGAAAGLLGGVYFPVDLLPGWLRALSGLLPTTHALTLARLSLTGAGASIDPRSVAFLGAYAFASLAAGSAVLAWGCSRARRDGTVGHY
jgi:ABC-2 type transport system permease protein